MTDRRPGTGTTSRSTSTRSTSPTPTRSTTRGRSTGRSAGLDTLHYDATNDFYVAARHEDVFTLSRDAETYCNKFGVRPKIAGDMSIITLDGDEHIRTRRLINKGFTPRRVRELIPHVRELSNEIIDQMAERGEVDFVRGLRHPRAADHHQRDAWASTPSSASTCTRGPTP